VRRTYLPRIIGYKVMMPADLKRLHKYLLDVEHIGIISDEMREVVVPGGLEYLAQRSDTGRDIAMSALLAGQPMKLDRWRALRMALSELLCHSS